MGKLKCQEPLAGPSKSKPKKGSDKPTDLTPDVVYSFLSGKRKAYVGGDTLVEGKHWGENIGGKFKSNLSLLCSPHKA